MKKKAHQLEFIGQVKRDGSGIKKVKKSYLKAMLKNPLMKNQDFELRYLSLTEGTFIAFNFNAFIVRIINTNKITMTKRTQEEIKERFLKIEDDFFGVIRTDLINYMEFESAKEFLNEGYVKKVEAGEEEWNQLTDPKKEILNYLSFAYEKAENERGLSAARSMDHFKTWIWLDDEDFYQKILPMLENYTDYGIPTLNKISKHYKFKK